MGDGTREEKEAAEVIREGREMAEATSEEGTVLRNLRDLNLINSVSS